ncbi:MAG: metalloregulator ArsR/SmtB family transcription factor [Patescibacteria group bacterium]
MAKDKDIERVLKALANKRRLMIVRLLKKHKMMNVGDIATEINLSFRATSRHLGVLLSAGILEREQQSLNMFYRIHAGLPEIAGRIISAL